MRMRTLMITLAAAMLLSRSLWGRPSACAGRSARQSDWPLWHCYIENFLDPQGRILDHDAGDRTTSEGQSYALSLPWSRTTALASIKSCHGQNKTSRKDRSKIICPPGSGKTNTEPGRPPTETLLPTPISGLPSLCLKQAVCGMTPR